jgi:prepilin-type N-terminal cleavage/methylation domain-containing protein
MNRSSQSGLTLIEVLVAVTLLSFLALAMIFAMRIGLMTYSKTESKLMLNRRVAGAQQILQQEIEGLVPVLVPCAGIPELKGAGEQKGPKVVFFQAEARAMRMVSTFSLQQAWRGQPQVLEFLVIPGEAGDGVRLVVNEAPYTPLTAGRACIGLGADPYTGKPGALYAPSQPGPQSFVLADQLAYCRFSYLVAPQSNDPKQPPTWQSNATSTSWPLAIRVEMAPLHPDPSRLQPMTVTAPIHIVRAPQIQYVDY